MVTRSDLLEGWSAEEIVTVEPELLAGLDIPETARRCLAEVGLPRAYPHYFTTVADRIQNRAVGVPDGASLIDAYRWRGLRHLRIGGNYANYVCVEAGSGHVIETPQEPGGATEPSFVNSSIETFLAFLLKVRLRQLAGGLDELGDEELEARAQVFRAALREVDPPALKDEEGYWSVIVEQMGYGHL